jgi:hypothetical protein
MTITTEQLDEQPIATPTPASPKRSRRALIGWAAVAAGVVAASTLAVAALASDGSSPAVDAKHTVVSEAPRSVPASADATEHWGTDRNAPQLGYTPGHGRMQAR